MDSGPLGGNMTIQPLYLTLPGTQTLERSGLHSKAERLALLESFSFSIWSLTCASTDAQENLFSPRPAMGWKERPQTARVGMAATGNAFPHVLRPPCTCFSIIPAASFSSCRTPGAAEPQGSVSHLLLLIPLVATVTMDLNVITTLVIPKFMSPAFISII